jgi:hypothetical protein
MVTLRCTTELAQVDWESALVGGSQTGPGRVKTEMKVALLRYWKAEPGLKLVQGLGLGSVWGRAVLGLYRNPAPEPIPLLAELEVERGPVPQRSAQVEQREQAVAPRKQP